MIIGGSDWSAQALERMLTPEGYMVLRSASARQAIQQLSPRPPDVFLVDTPHDASPPSAVCGMLRRHSAFDPATPVLVTCSTAVSRKERLASFRAGAWEVLSPPLETEELILKVGAFIRAKLAADAAREDALLDEATGFYNVRGLLRRVHEISADARRNQRPLACVVLTPVLNDGGADDQDIDAAVSFVGRVLRSFARSSDTIGRMSRTEFALVASGTDGLGARRLARRLEGVLTREAGERVEPCPEFRLRSASFAVQDARENAVEPAELLVRTAMILRQSLS
jgi:PleD family two-component response regulator